VDPIILVAVVAGYGVLLLSWDRISVARRRARCVDPALFRTFDAHLLPAELGSVVDRAHRFHLSLLSTRFVGPISAFLLRRRLASLLREAPTEPILHFELAHLHALRGEGERCLDALAKAMFHSRGDPFYARPLLESPWALAARPGLAREAAEKTQDSAV
jgi:hypothetical protein